MIPCSRQCSAAPRTADRERRAPWRKNSTAIATSLPIPTNRALSPLHGNITASATTAMMAAVKLSGSSRKTLLILPLRRPRRPGTLNAENPPTLRCGGF
jgi:hypothetical protein